MKIIFMGTPDFAVESLKALIQADFDVCCVVTIPDKAQGRGLKVKSSAVKKCALENNIKVIQPESLNQSNLLPQLQAFNADCFVVVAFKILPKEIFSIPPKGTVNVHASLLPAYRGAAPINWAIMNGDSKTGITTMLIDEKVDTGHILKQSEVQISREMNAGDLHDILAKKGADLLLETMSLIEKGNISAIVQDDAKATKAPKINSKTSLIDFSAPVEMVYNKIRGLSPYPSAYSFFNGKKVKILESRIYPQLITLKPGFLRKIDSTSVIVGCQDGAIEVLQLQIEGKKRMGIKDFLNGNKISTGDSFTISP